MSPTSFFSIRETEWSIHVENTFVETGFLCRSCGNKFHVTTLEKLQHMEGKNLSPQAIVMLGKNIIKQFVKSDLSHPTVRFISSRLFKGGCRHCINQIGDR